MSAEIVIRRAGPGVTLQDAGRSGYLSRGLSRGGAADPLALAEGAALLGQSPDLAAIEVAGSGLELEVTAPVWIALTGAPKQALSGRHELAWNACHRLEPGQSLHLGAALAGNFAYLHVAGGFQPPEIVGGRGAHLVAGLGAPLAEGARIPVGDDPDPARPRRQLAAVPRFDGGTIRILPGPQTPLFPDAVVERFLSTAFERTSWGNRQGVKLGFDGDGFAPDAGRKIISEAIVPGDIQITGDGTPYVLGVECQTIGGYPRLATVVPQDLPKVMQATPGARLRFEMVTVEEALRDHRKPGELVRQLQEALSLVADPYDSHALLAKNLVSGVVAGDEFYDVEDGT